LPSKPAACPTSKLVSAVLMDDEYATGCCR
jgi:hypothetical protein